MAEGLAVTQEVAGTRDEHGGGDANVLTGHTPPRSAPNIKSRREAAPRGWSDFYLDGRTVGRSLPNTKRGINATRKSQEEETRTIVGTRG
uniref:Uncharacterized protein n=1 Tax=Knipowitschia caucasica TaxID=637954 RepID=A0AAV2JCK7_KNICA